MHTSPLKSRTLALCTVIFTLTGCAAWLEAPLVDRPDQADSDTLDAGPDLSEMPETTGAHGDPCMYPSDCQSGLVCAGTQEAFRCMKRCDAPGTLCETGEVCTALAGTNASSAICYTGGGIDVGERCDTNLACEKGALCFGAGEDRYCLEACATSQTECDRSRDSCTLPEGNATGYCQAQVGSTCQDSNACLANDLNCSTAYSQDVEILQRLFTSPACTTTGCAVGQRCGSGAGHCVEVPGQSTKKLPVCMRSCERDADCRFQLGERCWSRDECAGRVDEGACEDLLPPDTGLCLHRNASFSF